MFKKLVISYLALLLTTVSPLAAGTTIVPIPDANYVDLGAAPVAVQVLSGVVQLVTTDPPKPTGTGRLGSSLSPTQYPITFNQADASSHIYAAALGGQAASLAVTPVLGSSVGAVTQGTVPWQDAAVLGTTNGWTALLANALSTTVKSIKGSAGQIGMLQCYNPNASPIYVQMFNILSGGVTLGTSAPLVSIPIGPTATGGFALSNPGINFSTAMSVAATTTPTGLTAPATAPDCNIAFN